MKFEAMKGCALATCATLVWLLSSGPALRADPAETLTYARGSYKTQITRSVRDRDTLPEPNTDYFNYVKYPTKLGPMGAYLSNATQAGKRQPAMIWVTGGFPVGGIGASAWLESPRDNDQSAKAYRLAGMIMMYPTFRGNAGNPGRQEFFYGEVDDLIAAAKYLAQRDDVDPKRIFLGGHSTGGTMALLAATTGHLFRGVICFGPVKSVKDYGSERALFDLRKTKECDLRAPIRFLDAIRAPTLVLEGASGNAAAVKAMRSANANKFVTFVTVAGAGHFDVLAPVNDYLAALLMKLGPDEELSFSPRAIQQAFSRGASRAPSPAPVKAKRPKRPQRKAKKDAGAANGAGWEIEAEAAFEASSRTKNPILALFTCSDRGAASQDLHKILASAEFKAWADESLVLLELDFPVRKRQSPKLKLQNIRLKGDYGVRSLPEVVFLSRDGKLLARVKRVKGGGAAAWVEAAKAALAKRR